MDSKKQKAYDLISPEYDSEKATYSPLTKYSVDNFHEDFLLIVKRAAMSIKRVTSTGLVSIPMIELASDPLFCVTSCKTADVLGNRLMVLNRSAASRSWEIPSKEENTLGLRSRQPSWKDVGSYLCDVGRNNSAIAVHRQCWEVFQALVLAKGSGCITPAALFKGALEGEGEGDNLRLYPWSFRQQIGTQIPNNFADDAARAFEETLRSGKIDEEVKNLISMKLCPGAYDGIDRYVFDHEQDKAPKLIVPRYSPLGSLSSKPY